MGRAKGDLEGGRLCTPEQTTSMLTSRNPRSPTTQSGNTALPSGSFRIYKTTFHHKKIPSPSPQNRFAYHNTNHQSDQRHPQKHPRPTGETPDKTKEKKKNQHPRSTDRSTSPLTKESKGPNDRQPLHRSSAHDAPPPSIPSPSGIIHTPSQKDKNPRQ